MEGAPPVAAGVWGAGAQLGSSEVAAQAVSHEAHTALYRVILTTMVSPISLAGRGRDARSAPGPSRRQLAGRVRGVGR